MGTGELIPRLMAQVGSASFGMALAQKNGFLNANGGLSALGMQRNKMFLVKLYGHIYTIQQLKV